MSTIAAISTPNAAGGIGMVRLSGENAVAIADACFRGVSGKRLTDLKGYTAAYGSYIKDGAVIPANSQVDKDISVPAKDNVIEEVFRV